jgi:sterol desaturase/sphingolipid hydroxylase (fatty acid hydroxylase superfamily)
VTTQAVAGYRGQYRRDHVPARYRAGLHLAFTFGAGGALLVVALLQLEAVATLEWLALPLSLLYANLAEYWGHRGPMHHRVRGLRLVFERHTRQHHRFFAHDAMAIDGPRDLRAVLFPPLLVTFFLTAFALPAGLLLAWLATPNVAWLFVAAIVGYFLNYELLHMAYHLPEGHALARTRLIRWLKPLHQLHHDPQWMTRCNFNITYPVGDRLFGTLRRDERFRHRPSAA